MHVPYKFAKELADKLSQIDLQNKLIWLCSVSIQYILYAFIMQYAEKR